MKTINGEIHKNELQRFKNWLLNNGWESETIAEPLLCVRNEQGEVMIFNSLPHAAHLSFPPQSLYLYWVSKYRLAMRQQKRQAVR